MSVAILMPAYNEAAALGEALASVRERAVELGGVTVFLVDDGSASPVLPEELPAPTASFRIVLARHSLNLGQGAALETARQLALRGGEHAAYVTMDADGQHCALDVVALARAVEAGADVAFGNRFLGGSNVPPLRHLLLRAARVFERVLTGLRLADAHNGLRAFSRRALELVPIRQNQMAHATEIKLRVSRAAELVIVEVPVSVRYTRETQEKGQTSLGAVVILRDLALQYLFGDSK